MNRSVGIPATLPVEFIDRTVFVGAELGFYGPGLGGVVVFDGRLDEARMGHALRLLLDAEPVLGCRLDADAVPPVWQRFGGLDSMRILDVRDSPAPAAAATKFVAEPFDFSVDPQVRAALFRGPSADVLVVRLGHYAADGGALKEAMYLIGDIYRTLGEQPDWTPEPNSAGVRSAMTGAGFFETLLSFRQSDVATLPSDWSVPLLGGRGAESYVTASVMPEVLRSAAVLGRSVGATVNDIILTAYYRTLYRVLDAVPGSRTPLMMTVDLRKHLPAGTRTALANISSAWSVSVSPKEDEAFDGTLARVVEATRAWKAAGAGRGSATGIPLVNAFTRKKGMNVVRKMMSGAVDPKADTKLGGAVLTNIGVIDERRLDFGTSAHIADAWLLAPVTPMGIGLAASTYRDHLVLSAGADFAATSEELVTDVVSGVAREIEEWVTARTDGV